MSRHFLTPLFSPRSVVLIGGSEREGSLGQVVLGNLLNGGFKGAIHIVNPRHQTVAGRPSHARVEDIEGPIDLALIACPPELVPPALEACAAKGVKVAIPVSPWPGDITRRKDPARDGVLRAAREAGMYILGPESFGILRPHLGLNATVSVATAKPGNVALVSQSSAMCNAILDWSRANEVPFSAVLSLGDAMDIGFSDVLDYLVGDPQTESILLYVEGVRRARRFMSALRAAARTKPVIVFKVGRHEAGRTAAITHSGTLVGADDVFDAALRRAGAVRVRTFVQLFSAAKCLAARYRPCGKNLAIVTNGGGPGIVAADWATDLGLSVAYLSDDTIGRLNKILPARWSHGNPVELVADAPASRFREATQAVLEDPGVDGALVVFAPQARSQPLETARAVIDLAASQAKPIVTCWLGDEHVEEAREALAEARIPTFRTPEHAVDAFSHITGYYQNQKLLVQVPPPVSHEEAPDVEGARILIESVLAERRHVLTEAESKALLAAFRIPVTQTVVARNANEALMLAQQIGYPLAMKIYSPDVTHKGEVGGVRLNISSAPAVRSAYTEIVAAVKAAQPDARIEGVALQPMSRKPNGRELMVGVITDPVFGPVITFGAGGVAVEVTGDRAVALPPLNHFLAADLVSRTRVAKTLNAFHHLPPVDRDALKSALLRVSEMVCELPWLKEMDINPLIVDEKGAMAVDARIVVDYPPLSASQRYAHMAIHPYPSHMVRNLELPDGTALTIRPIRPEDAELEQDFVRSLSAETKYFRFMDTLQELTPKMLERFTQIDYDREMAMVGVVRENGEDRIIGVSRYVTNPDGLSCEFAVVVGDDWHSRGIGSRLMLALEDAARDKGIETIIGDVLANNPGMLKLMHSLGYEINTHEDDTALRLVTKTL